MPDCEVYIDDIVMYKETLEDHELIKLNILGKLREFRVKINFERAVLLQQGQNY